MTCRSRRGRRHRRKPRLTLAEYRLLCEMRWTFEHGGIRRGGGLDRVEQLACDTMDGGSWHTDPEVRGLVRKRLIYQYRHGGKPEVYCNEHGERVRADCPFTWHLTERGARLVAPEAFGDAS